MLRGWGPGWQIQETRRRNVTNMASMPTAPVVAAGLIGGFAVARYTGRRPLGGIVLAAGGVMCGRLWLRSTGPGTTGTLAATYVAAFGASHPLAKKIGAWPAVFTVSALASAVAYALADRAEYQESRKIARTAFLTDAG